MPSQDELSHVNNELKREAERLRVALELSGSDKRRASVYVCWCNAGADVLQEEYQGKLQSLMQQTRDIKEQHGLLLAGMKDIDSLEAWTPLP